MDEHMARILKSLTADEIMSLSVSDLAGKFSCSRRHLNRLFWEHFGMPAAALRMETRLLRAAALLRDSDVKVILAAEQSGFNHLGLFNSCFKRRFGVSPGQWRNRTPEVESPLAKLLAGDPRCPLRAAGLCA
jgi:transcriptional regulator GlxA family with amidase domain